MRKRFMATMLAVSLVVCGLSVQNASAESLDVVISQVQLGPSGMASNEFVELYNNSASDVEITNWCLYYASAASSQRGDTLVCFKPTSASVHLYLPGNSSVFAISNQLALAQPNLGYDFIFSPTLAGSAGHLRLMTDSGIEVDKLGWGATVASAEGASPAAVPSTGNVLQRKSSDALTLQDTDVNSSDFESASTRSLYSYGMIYEVFDVCDNIDGTQAQIPVDYQADQQGNCSPPPVDVCANIDGLQVAVPLGYGLDENGNCIIDVCGNLDGLQSSLPDNFEYNQNGDCVEHDECSNVTGAQADIPTGLKRGNDGRCVLDLFPIKITEMLANAIGNDSGKEFIELYNPNDVSVDLTHYVLWVGLGTPKSYTFPNGSRIEPGEYISFSDESIGFTLLNSSGQVSIRSLDDTLIDGPYLYDGPGEDMSWALIGESWGYTNRPTPGSANVPSLIIEDEQEEVPISATLIPCAANQSRNLETNRCRLLASTGTALVPCGDDQYRSEETNRCRSIVAAARTLEACQADEERNPATNRCRQVAVAGVSISDCKEGQERNLETNRCRAIVKISEAAYPIEPITAVNDGVNYGWLALGVVGALALSYGVWEWRSEIMQVSRRLRSHFLVKK